MPFDHGLRLDNRQRIANVREKPIKANKNQSVDGAEGLFLRSGSPQNVYLLPQHPNFHLKRCPRPKQICDHPNNEPDKISHPARASPDSRSTASQIEFAIGTAEERQRLLQMGADLEAAWHHPAATAITRKRIIRVVLHEVVARVEDDQIQLLLHWQGGDHTRLTVRKNRRGQTRWSVEPETIELIRACARLMPDKAIAGMLNRTGKRTGRLNGWTQSRVRGFRNTHGIAVYVDGEWAKRGEVTLTQAARMLDLSPLTVLRRIQAGIIPAEQYCKGAPWVIKRRDIEGQHLVLRAKMDRKAPASSDPDQRTLVFQ